MINNGGYGGGSKCGRPNLGRPNLGGAGNKSKGNKGDDKKIKERFLSKKPSIKQPKSSTSAFSTAKRVPKKQKVADLSIQAMGVDPASFNVHKPQQKYDVLQSKSTTETSELVLESSCASKEEFYELRKKELKQRQKEKEAERMQRMQELQLEAKKRLKEFDQMEAPFKKIREKSKDAKKSEFVEDLLYLAIEAAKPAPVGPIRNYSAEDRERETNLLVDLINQKREEVQHTKKLQELDDDVIVIGNVQVPVEQPKTFKKQTSGSSTARSHAPPLQEIPLNENNDLIAIAAVSKNTLNIPPEDSENGIKSNEKSHETGLFYFNGLPIDIPGVDSITCLERADCLIQFIEQGLGPEMLQEAKDFLLVAPKMDEKEAETKFREVFSNPEEMKYYPFVQHLLFCENFKQTTQLPKPSHYSATNEEEEEDQLQQNQENQENGEFEEEEQQQEFEEEEEEGIEKDE
ncbi:hypothetical protein TRFO_21489 [Tritrichomonas foetus]|uniref:Uncharacterized protein n=1 Tax=Tritrichomonas foetus TaxID=1144522 RepID=A0A1J4KDU2_9EUKA|nr:hypothetical protein TRFO_21489 [Tritrichomonas foetus]|eukprot:OHT09599.1 hypothetical protein TRFO_21489 [Tritrichomonas foetus]